MGLPVSLAAIADEWVGGFEMAMTETTLENMDPDAAGFNIGLFLAAGFGLWGNGVVGSAGLVIADVIVGQVAHLTPPSRLSRESCNLSKPPLAFYFPLFAIPTKKVRGIFQIAGGHRIA